MRFAIWITVGVLGLVVSGSAYAQRGGGAGGCAGGGGTGAGIASGAAVANMGLSTGATGLANVALARGLFGASSGSNSISPLAVQQAYQMQMQLAYARAVQEEERAQQRLADEEQKQLVAQRQKRREAQEAKRVAARARNLARRSASIAKSSRPAATQLASRVAR